MKERKLDLDFVRIIACFFVIYIHTCGVIVDKAEISVTYCFSLLIMFIAKTAVPLFLLISGACLLNKETNIKRWLLSILRIVLVIIIFSLLYLSWYKDSSDNLFSFYFSTIYSSYIIGVYWYLYCYLGILIVLPLLRRIHFDTKDYLYLFLLYMIFQGIIPFFCYYFSLPIYNDKILLVFFSTYTVCLFLGDFLENKFDWKSYFSKYNIYVVLILIFDLLISLFFVLRDIKLTGTTNLNAIYDTQCYFTTMVATACIFLLVKTTCFHFKFSNIIHKSISEYGKSTFGIYLIHMKVISILEKLQIKQYLINNLNDLIAILIFDVIVFFVSFILIESVRHLPIMRKLI